MPTEKDVTVHSFTFTHDLTSIIRSDLEAAEKQNPGTKFTALVEMQTTLELKVTLVPETQEPI